MSHTLEELNNLYNDAENCDKSIFNEMKSNILLVSGDHYKKVSSRISRNLENTSASDEQKLRLTMNHTQKISKTIKNGILAHAPDVTPLPYNENEPSDQKNAEISKSVWEDGKESQNFADKRNDWVDCFSDIGEVCTFTYQDPSKGKFVGYNQKTNDAGEPLFIDRMGAFTPMPTDEFGQPHELAPDEENPKFSGELVIETVLPFNLLRDANAEDMKLSPWYCIRKMIPVKDAKKFAIDCGMDPSEADRVISESASTTFKVFDQNLGYHKDADGQMLLRWYFFRQSRQYPRGYFYVTADSYAIISEGELPGGEDPDCFPIVWEGYDKIPTSARARSWIKHIRPYQAEINRCSSEISTQQIHLGYPKVLISKGSQVGKGISKAGVRFIPISGAPPVFMETRNGENYFEYLKMKIEEMYRVAGVNEMDVEQNGQLDPYAMIYRSLRDKKKFSIYAQKFERFLIQVCKTYLKLAQLYYDDQKIIRAAGRKEIVNIAEFKNVQPWDIKIKVVPVTDDVDSTVGKMIEIQNIIQYAGKDLPEEVKGKLFRLMPYLNEEQAFEELTINYDMAMDMILAMDRGETFTPNDFDDAERMVKTLIGRMRKSDFKYLSPQIRMNYQNLRSYYEGLVVKQQEEIKRAQQGFIPTSGDLVKVDLNEVNPVTGNPRRLALPADALDWLKKKIADQGLAQDRLMEIRNQAELANIANRFNTGNQGVGEIQGLMSGQTPMAQGGY